MKMSMHKVFIDTETSGLDNLKHQILTVAIVLCDNNGNEVFSEEYKVKQQDWAEINTRALEVNGIVLEEHNKTALSELEVAQKIHDVLKMYGLFRPIVIGQNVTFDIGFLQNMFKRTELKYPFDYHFQDTMVLANVLKDVGKMPIVNVKLVTIANFFGLSTDFHRALEDARMTAKVYYKMIELIR